MTDAFRWFMGLRQSPDWAADGDWHIQFQSLPQGVWAAVALLLMIAAVVGVWFLYRREGRSLSLPVRLLLAALRLGVLTCVVFMLMEMVLVINKQEHVPAHLLLLVDDSESMRLSDPYTDEATGLRTAQHLGIVNSSGQADLKQLRDQKRIDLTRRALGPLWDSLGQDRVLAAYGFAGKLQPLANRQALDGLKANGVDTRIGDAIENALAAHRGQPLAGVLIVTDGQSNAGSDPRKIAQTAGKDGVPIFSLAIGTEQGPANARLADIEVSPIVFVHDTTEVAVLVESKGMQGRTGVVTLEQRPTGGDWTEIGREEITLGEDSSIRRIPFKITPENTGDLEFRAKISDAGPELTQADNVATKTIKVIRQRIRVLLLAGYPSPEMQFMRNALMRDPSIEFASWLQNAGEGYEHIGHKPLRRLPNTSQELNQYDVVVLFDPDMRKLSGWSEMLTKFVGDAGGGLVYIAGELYTRDLFAGHAGESNEGASIDNAWLRALPVAADPGLYQSAADIRLSARDTWNLELTPEGAADPVFRFSPDPSRNREILASLPGMYWHFPVTRAKSGATVLARHGDPRMQNSFGRHVLMATQRYGPGRTVWLGFDATFRWRYLSEEYFDGFWARLVDRLGRSKVLGGRYPFTLATDKSVYRTGDRVRLRATMIQTSDDAAPISELRGEFDVAGQTATPVQFEALPEQPGVMEATFAADEAGPYQVRVVPATGRDADAALRPATLNFKVDPPRQELDNPTLNRALLDDLARASGGRVFTLAETAEIPAAFKVHRVEHTLEFRDELWDAPLLFSGVVILLTIEWILRKRFRMA